MAATPPYTEEAFGILTDDDLYLDALFVRPTNAEDKDIKVLRVWIPKFPLTKTSIIACARQEVKSYGPDGKIAHLVFDLRSTGDSDGLPGDLNFNLDLAAVKAWAEERFGPKINFGFFGFPYSRQGRVYVWPLRPGTVMESYYYKPTGAELSPPTILYLSSYGNFSRTDDELCAALAEAGYNVYGLDPFRYLLHASMHDLLTPEQLWEDLRLLIQMLPNEPTIIAQPLASGLALMWASRTPNIRGLVAIGRAQSGLAPAHVFQNKNPHTFFLPRYVGHIAPRPTVLVHHENHPMGGVTQNVQALYDSLREPRRLEKVQDVSGEFLLEMVTWIHEQRPDSRDKASVPAAKNLEREARR
ncbi:MAG: hypothetical protein KC413_06385 [Anaerolineales bacterium]|nr:hypothetical protein [Anaerolineales bacterium]MCA9975356.1 hypothetical protein [Anaerolineales bacterium]